MELKVGYKQTEVGVIPTDWEVQSVNHVSVIRTGPFGTLLKASEYSVGDGVPLISVGEIRHGFLKISTHTPRISPTIARKLPQFVLQAGDIVFGRKGGVDRSALIQKSQDGWFIGSDGIIVRPVKKIYCAYLAFQLQSERVKDWLLQNAIGTTMPSLNQGILGKVVVPLPPTKSEQEAIAEALSDADALIESLDQLIAKKRQIKQGAMQELLTGKRRLPGFGGEWEVKRLGSVLKFQVGFPFSSIYFNETGQGIRLVKNRDLKSDDQIIYYSGGYGDNFLVKNGDVLIGMDGDFLPCLWSKGVSLLNQRVGRILPLAGLSNLYAFYFLIQPLKDIENVTSSTTVKHLSHRDIEGIVKPLPTLDEQSAIATFLSNMDAELAALESRLAKARQIKQGLMQELLTGRIRLV